MWDSREVGREDLMRRTYVGSFLYTHGRTRLVGFPLFVMVGSIVGALFFDDPKDVFVLAVHCFSS